MGRLSVPNREVLEAMRDLGASAWINSHWLHGARRIPSGRPRPQVLPSGARRGSAELTRARPSWRVVVGLAAASLASMAIGASTRVEVAHGRGPRDHVDEALGALRNALAVGGVASAATMAAERAQGPIRAASWVGRAAVVALAVCGLGAVALQGVLATRRASR